MTKITKPKFYPPLEEKWNIISHGAGFALSVLALVLLIFRAYELGDLKHMIGFSIFGASMVLLYAASTFYHSAKTNLLRYRLNILDHASIYVLIAGTYTPFALITISGTTGWTILVIVWTMAVAGIILKLFYTGRYNLLSTIMYVVMGWLIVFAIQPLVENMPGAGLWWLFGGGISYTLGAVIFMRDRLPFNHAVFHLLVLLGTFCHFISIYFYTIPAS